jgi:thiol:disulfide interchange protein/DsbC/DsbD-like thiol-disulfide interchange protein
MNGTRAVLAVAVLLHASVASAQVHEGRTIVSARLIADTTSVQPGRPFTAGVHLSVAPGWHVYWENPGDTALPIQIAWQLPQRITASGLRWPRPERYQENGGITVFGYEGETLLASTIAPPKRLAEKAITLGAKASWLVCEKVCIPGEADLTVTLPVGEPSMSADAATIERFAAQVPVSDSEAGIGITRARASRVGTRWAFAVDVESAGRRILAFFPRSIEGFTIDHGRIAIKGNTVEFSAEPDDDNVRPRGLSGVVETDGGSYDVSGVLTGPEAKVPLPSSSPPPERRSDEPKAEEPAVAASSSASGDDDWLAREFKTSVSGSHLPIATALIFAAVGGLLLNIMPCVLPVISLKVLGFVHQAGNRSGRTRLLGLMFAAGVLVSFWLLVAGVWALRATGEQIGWGFQFQSPGFVVTMSVVVLVFAMSLFGVFEIEAPQLSGSAVRGDGRAGAFFHGMLATVLATPCTAPFLGTALGFAFTQPLPVLFFTFTAAALGLALPYVLLAWNPAWLRWVPRPGMWMIRFKQAMGFVLLATVVWLLSILGAQLGPEGVVWSLAFLLIVAFAVWMVGHAPARTSRSLRAAWGLAAAVVAIGGYVWALEIELRWREPIAATLNDVSSSPGAVRWERFSLADLRERVERGETVFIDFTAAWCWSCKVNERTVLASSSVQDRIRELRVTQVRADWTNRNPEITRLLAKFGRVGVPFYVVFPARRLTEPIGLSEVITPASVIDALDRAGPSQLERASLIHGL